MEILVSHPLEEYSAFEGFVFKVMVTVNCLQSQPLPGDFLTILNFAQRTTVGRLRPPLSSLHRQETSSYPFRS